LLLGTLFIPQLYFPNDGIVFLIVFGTFTWGASIALYNILTSKNNPEFTTSIKGAGIYLLIGFIINLGLFFMYILYIPISGLVFLVMVIYGGIKIFRHSKSATP
jgi:hypothetical protein